MYCQKLRGPYGHHIQGRGHRAVILPGSVDMKDFQNTDNLYMVPLSINKVNSSIKLLNTTTVQ